MQNLRIGQLWTFSQSNQEIFLLILRMETIKKEEIVHISIISKDGGVIIEHIPFSKHAIEKSILKLVENKEVNEQYLDGYNYWKTEYNNNKAGIYSTKVDEVLNL